MENNIIKLIDMCSFQISDEEFMGNISVVLEKIVLLVNERQLNDIVVLQKQQSYFNNWHRPNL